MTTPFIDIHTHVPKEEHDLFQLLNRIIGEEELDNRICSVGIHPWYIHDIANQIHEIEQKANLQNVLAIGECGLDKICETDWSLQVKAFELQIQLANTLQKPLIIHAVKAYQEIMEVLKKQKVHVPVLFHGFNKNKELAKSLLNQGYYISLGTSILNGTQDELIKEIDLNNFFLETDNKSINIVDIYSYFCAARKITVSDLKEQLAQNLQNVFKYNIST